MLWISEQFELMNMNQPLKKIVQKLPQTSLLKKRPRCFKYDIFWWFCISSLHQPIGKEVETCFPFTFTMNLKAENGFIQKNHSMFGFEHYKLRRVLRSYEYFKTILSLSKRGYIKVVFVKVKISIRIFLCVMIKKNELRITVRKKRNVPSRLWI